ncbi:hypothetical protein BVC80_9057g71 [Macleaya cordata]|uniref:Uncharacterized protein n=1 Tax=Macleaya cordata TaxID=56857 RepID=A0A200R9W3_MACCD|nr:hypothetical protein BVC80_9057g71 [Macleaya cordata]
MDSPWILIANENSPLDDIEQFSVGCARPCWALARSVVHSTTTIEEEEESFKLGLSPVLMAKVMGLSYRVWDGLQNPLLKPIRSKLQGGPGVGLWAKIADLALVQ